MNKRHNVLKGFTLVEVMVVVIIIGVLAAIGIPQYTKTLEKGKMREAEANLYTMYMAEKMYKLDHPSTTVSTYACCSFGLKPSEKLGICPSYTPKTAGTVDSCNDILDLEMTKKYFNYKVETEGTGLTSRFYVVADRNSGKFDGCIMVVASESFGFSGDCGVDFAKTDFETGNIGKCNCP